MTDIHDLLEPHSPTIIDALIHRDCVEEACGHLQDGTDDCPTHAVMVCMTCMENPEIGSVGFAVDWPCQHAGDQPDVRR